MGREGWGGRESRKRNCLQGGRLTFISIGLSMLPYGTLRDRARSELAGGKGTMSWV